MDKGNIELIEKLGKQLNIDDNIIDHAKSVYEFVINNKSKFKKQNGFFFVGAIASLYYSVKSRKNCSAVVLKDWVKKIDYQNFYSAKRTLNHHVLFLYNEILTLQQERPTVCSFDPKPHLEKLIKEYNITDLEAINNTLLFLRMVKEQKKHIGRSPHLIAGAVFALSILEIYEYKICFNDVAKSLNTNPLTLRNNIDSLRQKLGLPTAHGYYNRRYDESFRNYSKKLFFNILNNFESKK